MTTHGRERRADRMVDLLQGGDDAEALFERWLSQGPPGVPQAPVPVEGDVAAPAPAEDDAKPAAWGRPGSWQPMRRPR
ncbi:hypothetical protein CKO44_18670 [Rubrivivax gelatinosus]|uniref:Uncharacterized protein n=1 Tax=Rubrivivax gelatinosus TaxID=28068 RepID=A0ABS1DUC1_RUBGE|nr:hypothetical protein [Rubrivivax gelatinosus]MBK1615488.1 hypothetical protein [Rubrivivax gelatinosus]MBK1713108.1 hypothetical protein [Rubrivivax gelatinosus]